MKTFKIFSTLPLFIAFIALSLPESSFAQNTKAEAIGSFTQRTKTETIPVSGNCGMCKTAIEKAARKAGAASAEWGIDSKELTVKYHTSTTNAAKIQQSIAAVGYDTRDFKTTDAAYNKLPACCQYDRTEAKQAKHQCTEKCGMKDGKCADMAACKEKACCKDEASCKEKGCCNMDKSAAAGEKTKASCCSKMEATMASNGSKEMSCCSAMH